MNQHKEVTQTTFAEDLVECMRSNNLRLDKINKLISLALKTPENDEGQKEREMLIKQAKNYLKLVDKKTLEFEAKHGEKLEKLEQYLKTKGVR